RDAEASTKATFVIEDRVPGLNQTYLRPYVSGLEARNMRDLVEETVRNETRRP
ncbi:MAG: alkaline phosphatase, partial [Actinomadura rubrobrunea]|nr:alkaline phosphatase [Actinomadura rubrobrunea]